jgi:hypothetical protein
MWLNRIRQGTLGIDWTLFLATLPLLFLGWITMNSFVGESMGEKYVEQPPFSIFETFS